ncbi:MAG: hypothetical protein DIU54_011565 [Acidobacteriota bacterium]|jgi:hypothetical protein
MLRTLALILALAAGPAPAAPSSQQTPANPLGTVKAWSCSFGIFAVGQWDDPPTVAAGKDDLTFRVEALDLRRGAARIVAAGTTEVTARLTPTGLNLIEQTPGGNFILTTIFTSTVAADTYHAVHARHLGDPSTPPSASQFYGTCTATE